MASLRALTIDAGHLNNARGSIKSNDELAIGTQAFTYQGDIDSAAIGITAEGPVRIESGDEWRTSGDLNLSALGAVVFNGKLQAAGNLTVDAASLSIGTQGLAAAQGDSDFRLSGKLDNRNRLSSASTLTVNAGQVLNYADLGGRQADISAGRITNRGLLFGAESLALNADYIENEMGGLSGSSAETGDIFSFGDLSLQGRNGGRAKLIRNRQGLIRAEGDIAINTDSLENLGDWTVGETFTETGAYEYSHGEACYTTPNKRCLPSGERMSEGERAFRTQTVREVVTVEDYSPASLIAGGKLTGHVGRLSNRYSYIGANGSITLEGNELNNTAATADVDSTITSHSRYWTWDDHTFGSDTRDNHNDDVVVTHLTETVTLAGATIESAGSVSLNFSGTVDNGTLTGHVSAVSQTGVSKTLDTTVTGGSGVSLSAGHLGGAAVVDSLVLNNFALPDGSGLFIVNDNPDHPYLVETNPLLTDYASFTSSDYLLDRLDWDGAEYMRRIGDGFYELTLVEQSLQARTGSRLLDGQGGMTMFQQLMDNAVIANEDLKLTPGVALTKDQVNRLTRSMIWMETREVNGESLLVPVVYLSAGQDLAYDNGALIAGRNVSITGGSDVVNAGVISALDALTISSKQGGLTNREGRLQAGRQVDINVARDILNQSGEITAADIHLNAGGNIRNETLVDNIGSLDSIAISRKGQNASIIADKNLTVSAVGNVIDQAGKLQAGEGLAISAGGDIRFESQKQVTGFNVAHGHDKQILERVDHLTSTVDAGRNLTLNAGNDIAIQGAQISAAKNAHLQAGGNIDVVAVADTTHSEVHYRVEGSGFGSDKKVDKTSDSLVHKEASVSAGDSLTVSSGNNLQVYGSKLQGGGDVSIAAGGDIQLVAAVDQQQENYQKTEKNSVRQKSKIHGYHHETALGSLVTSGGDLSLDSGADIQITGSDLAAGERLLIGESLVERTGDEYKTVSGDNVKNLTVDAVALNNEEWAESSRSYTGIVKSLAKVATYTIAGVMGAGMDTPAIELASRKEDRVQTLSHQGSQLAANDIAVNVDETARFLGATVSSNGGLKVNAENIEIDAVASTTSETHVSEKETVKGLGAKLKRDELRLGGIEERKDRQTHTQVTTQWQGSQISAGNIELNAGDSVQVTASDVASAGDIDIQAGNSIQVSGRQDTQTTTDSSHTEIRTTSAGVKNAYVDAAYALQAMNDARQAVSDAKKALSEAKDKVAQGKVREQDLKYYRANLAAATANLAQAGIAFVASGATAAASTATGGFYATGSAQRQTIDSSHSEQSASWNGSQLVAGGDASLKSGEAIDVKGSDVAVNGTLAIDSKAINISAGTDTGETSSSNRETNQNVSVSYGAQGLSGSVDAGYRRSESDGSSLAHRNSTIDAGALESTSDTLTVAGANIEAGTIDIDTDTLDIRSLQDESHSKSKTRGGNAGFGVSNGAVSSVSVGVEMADGSANRTWTDNQTSIIGRESVTVNAKDTTLTGAVIANATTDANGQLVDQGNLSLTTETLTVADLEDTDRSENRGINLGVTVNLSGEPRNEEQLNGPQTGQTTVGGHYYGHDRAQTTHATIGQGQIVVGGTEQDAVAGLNRELENSQEVTRDLDIGGLDASVTVDHRVLTAAGWDSIIDDATDTIEHVEDIGVAANQVATDDEMSLLHFAGQVNKEAKITQLGKVLATDYPELLEILNSDRGGPQSQAAFAQVAELGKTLFGLDLRGTSFYDGQLTTGILADIDTEVGKRDVMGAITTDPNHPGYGRTLLDVSNTDKAGLMTTIGHEIIEGRVLEGRESWFFEDSHETKEHIADVFGESLTRELNKQSGGGLSQTPAGWSAAMRQTEEAAQGTLLANTLSAGQVEYRQFRTNESRALDQARAALENNSFYSEAYKHEALANLDALACAEVRCGSGSSENDPLYKKYHEMEVRGEQLKQTQKTDIYAMLDQLGVSSTEEKTVGRGRRQHTREEPLFGYTALDYLDDKVGHFEKASAKVQQGGMVVGGTAVAIGGVTTATVTCAGSAGVLCAAGGLGGAYLFSEGAGAASEGWNALISDYVYTNSARVRDSFSEATNQEGVSPTLALLTNVVANVAGGVVAKRAGSLILQEKLPAVSGASAVPNSLNIAQRLDELKIEGHGPQRHSGLTEPQLVNRVFDGIDPATVSRVDLVHSPKLHKKPSEATTFITDDAFVRAEHSVRSSQAFQDAVRLNPERPVVKISLQDALGNNSQNQVVGIRKIGPRENRQYEGLDFSNGSVQAFYRYDSQTRSYVLETMFPTQYPVD